MARFYLTPKQDDFNKIPELQICRIFRRTVTDLLLTPALAQSGYEFRQPVLIFDHYASCSASFSGTHSPPRSNTCTSKAG
ncbi:MAG: hypothetical protein V3V96_12835 [Acidiferrobacterales bacterium]